MIRMSDIRSVAFRFSGSMPEKRKTHIKKVVPEGRPEMDYKSFLRGVH